MAALDQLPPGARILVVRLRSLGDCVLTTPALGLLRQARPDLRLGVVVEPRFAPVFTRNSDIDELLDPSAGGVVRFGADLCLNLHGGTRSVALTVLSRARLRAGFAHFRHSWAYNIRIPRAQEILGVERTVHTAEHLASAIFHLGVPKAEIPRARLFTTPYRNELRGGSPDRPEACPTRRAYAVLHPVASAADKTWPAERFLEVAAQIESQWGLEPIFIAGPGEPLDAFRKWKVWEGAPLDDVKALLAGATLFVGNDSGPAHVAAAFGIPMVVLFGSSDPVIWAPWKTPAAVKPMTSTAKDVVAALEKLRVNA